MSLYNMLFGINEDMPILLGMIGTNIEYFNRFRDIELIEQGTKIRVFTRLGGGNRKDYTETWEKIKKHELYLSDYDDDFDNTYAYIEFDIPSKYKETAKKMFKSEPPRFSDKFKKELEDMNNPNTEASKRAEEIAKRITDAMEKRWINFIYRFIRMNIGNSARPRYVCDKCQKEIPYTYRKGINVHKYGKWTNSCYSKDFDLCCTCERKLRQWLKTQEVPTRKEIIDIFPIYEEEQI